MRPGSKVAPSAVRWLRPWLGPIRRNDVASQPAVDPYGQQCLLHSAMSVISLPDRDETSNKRWTLRGIRGRGRGHRQLKYERRKAKVKAALEGLRRRGLCRDQGPTRIHFGAAKSVKQPSWRPSSPAQDDLGNDRPDATSLPQLPKVNWNKPVDAAMTGLCWSTRLREW